MIFYAWFDAGLHKDKMVKLLLWLIKDRRPMHCGCVASYIAS